MTALVVGATGARGFGRFWPCSIGKGGITTNKSEGDGATPTGRLVITGCLYRPDRLRQPAPWAVPLGSRDIWCDDPDHALYNLATRRPFAGSHERLSRGDRLYDIILTTDWNWPSAVPGKGSAIFIHCWRSPRYPTQGCVAFSPSDIRDLAALMPPGASIEIRA